MKSLLTLLILSLVVTFSLSANPLMLKKNFEYDATVKNVNAFELFIVGNMELVISLDYELKITKNNESKKAKKKTDELMVVLPIPNNIVKWKTTNNTLFKDLYNSTLPIKKKVVKKRKKLPKPLRRVNNKFKVIVQEIFKTDKLGQKAFNALNEHLKKNGYNELQFSDYKYYIDRDWTFIAVKYVVKKGSIPKKGNLQPIYLSLEAANVAFPLRAFKEYKNFNFNFYILSNFNMDLKDIKKFKLSTVDMDDNDLEQKNRITILTELGGSVIDFYDAISETNEIFKDMETTTLNMFHIYGKGLNKGKNTLTFSPSDDLMLDNK